MKKLPRMDSAYVEVDIEDEFFDQWSPVITLTLKVIVRNVFAGVITSSA